MQRSSSSGALTPDRNRSSDDGPLRTAQGGLQPVRGSPALQAAYTQFFKTRCPIETVRAAEASGFDKSLWERLCAMGATTMALPDPWWGRGDARRSDAGGRGDRPVAGSGAVDRPCVRRPLAGVGADSADYRPMWSTASSLPPGSAEDSVSGVRLIPTGSIADHVIVRDGGRLVRLTFASRPAQGRQHRPAADGLGRPICCG